MKIIIELLVEETAKFSSPLTAEEIQEYNKRCAEFIGFFDEETDRFIFDIKLFNFQSYSFSEKHHKNQLCFDVGWNWIMEVIKKIESLTVNTRISIESHSCKLTQDNYSNIEIGLTKKEAVIQAINQFLIFYNEKYGIDKTQIDDIKQDKK